MEGIEGRLLELERGEFIQGMLLRILVGKLLSRADQDVLREQMCSAIDQWAEEGRLIDHDGLALPSMLAKLEPLFPKPEPKPDRHSPEGGQPD